MVGVFSPEVDPLRRIRELLPGERSVWSTSEWQRFREPAASLECGVVVVPEADPCLLARLRRWRADFPALPLVLVTRRAPDLLRALRDVVVEEVVWLDRLEEDLAPAVEEALAEDFFRDVGRRLETAAHLPPVLAEALATAARARPPVHSVQALARQMGRDRRTLWHHWNHAVGERTDLTPKGFLDWILVARAASLKRPSVDWKDVAEALEVHVRTLRRAVKRRLGGSLRDLPGAGRRRIYGRLRQDALAPLLASGPADGEDAGVLTRRGPRDPR